MYDEKCPKCGRESDYSCLGGLCKNCKRNGKKTILLVCSLLAIVFMIIGAFVGWICFNYEIDKCSNLKSSESSYDFDKTIELDADYNEHCYYINNHPFALLNYLFSGILFGILIPILIGVLWSFAYI